MIETSSCGHFDYYFVEMKICLSISYNIAIQMKICLSISYNIAIGGHILQMFCYYDSPIFSLLFQEVAAINRFFLI